MRLERIETITPQIVQGSSNLREPLQIDAVQPPFGIDPDVHQTRIAHELQVRTRC